MRFDELTDEEAHELLKLLNEQLAAMMTDEKTIQLMKEAWGIADEFDPRN